MLSNHDAPLPCAAKPDHWYSPRPEIQELAKTVCRSCPRMQECLEQALLLGEQLGSHLTGIHGGMNQQERIREALRRAA